MGHVFRSQCVSHCRWQSWLIQDRAVSWKFQEELTFLSVLWDWQRHVFLCSSLSKAPLRTRESYKCASVFNKRIYFHVCQSGLPTGLGHDLFEGAVSIDLVLMSHLVDEWKHFTYLDSNQWINQFHYLGNDRNDKPSEVVAGSWKLHWNGTFWGHCPCSLATRLIRLLIMRSGSLSYSADRWMKLSAPQKFLLINSILAGTDWWLFFIFPSISPKAPAP